jgi:ABC-type multidrug transport system fused ATPase/permease subunit
LVRGFTITIDERPAPENLCGWYSNLSNCGGTGSPASRSIAAVSLSVVRRLLSELSRDRSGGGRFFARGLGVLALASLSGAVMGLVPSFVGLGVTALGGPGPKGGVLAPLEQLGLSLPAKLALAVALTALAVVGSFASSRVAAAFSADTTRALRALMVARVCAAPPRAIEALGAALASPVGGVAPKAPPGITMKAPPAGDAVKLAILRDGQMGAELCVSIVSNLPQALVGLATLAIDLFSRGSGLVAAIGAAVFGLSRALSYRSSRRMSERTKALSLADTALFGELTEKLTSLEDFRLAGATELAEREVGAALHRAADEKKAVAKVVAESGQIASLVTTLSPLFVVLFLGLTGRSTSPADVAHLLVSLPLVIGRLGALDGLRLALVEKESVLQAVAQVLDLSASPAASGGGAGDSPSSNTIFVRAVSLELNGKKILNEVSFEIPEGAIVGLVGPSGSGKSTFLRLLLGLDAPTAGAIQLGEADLRDLSVEARAGLFGAELQSGKVLGRTVRENVLLHALGRGDDVDSDAARAAARAALERAQIPSLASSEGLEKRFVPVPPNLSGGEQKRVLVARAVASEAPILVLDEPEAGLPDETAKQLFDALLAAREGRTVVVVTHAPALLPSDFNVVFDAGRVVDVGSHAELLERSPLYAKLLASPAAPRAPAGTAPPGAGPAATPRGV